MVGSALAAQCWAHEAHSDAVPLGRCGAAGLFLVTSAMRHWAPPFRSAALWALACILTTRRLKTVLSSS